MDELVEIWKECYEAAAGVGGTLGYTERLKVSITNALFAARVAEMHRSTLVELRSRD
jgi:hypothetical protein